MYDMETWLCKHETKCLLSCSLFTNCLCGFNLNNGIWTHSIHHWGFIISYIYIYIYSDSVCVACESEESQSFKLSHGPFQWYEHFIYPIMLLMFWAHSPISIVTCICLKSGRTQKCCHRPLKYRCPVTKSDNTRPTKPYEMPCGANGQLLVSLLVYIMWSLHLVHFDFYLFFEFGVIRWCMGK